MALVFTSGANIVWNSRNNSFQWNKCKGGVTISIHDILGRSIANYSSGNIASGEYSVGFLARGTFITRIRAGNSEVTFKIVNGLDQKLSGVFATIRSPLLTANIEEGPVETVLTSNEVEFPNINPGAKINVKKVYNKLSGKLELKGDKTADDIEKMREEERKYLRNKYGAVTANLREVLEKSKDDDSLTVVIVAVLPVFYDLDKTKYTEEECYANTLKMMQQKPAKSIRSIIVEAGQKIGSVKSESEGSIVCKLRKEEINALRFNQAIAAISRYIEPELCAAPMSSAATSAYNPPPMPTNARGSGVKAATFESGIWTHSWRSELNDYVDHFAARGNLVAGNIYQDNNAEEHSQVTFSFLWYTAPNATFYHKLGAFYGNSFSDPEALEIINNGLQTLSCSYANSSDENSPNMLVIDDFAYRAPRPVFCNPAANTQQGPKVNWVCYNAISVGSFQHTDLTTYIWASHSLWENPDPVYGSNPDREMPYVLATGKWPFLDNSTPPDPDCMPGAPELIGWAYETALKTSYCHVCQGTSFAAPTANGIAADIISASNRMKNWPEKVRVAMMLTAQNCDGDEWNTQIADGKDGTGAVSGNEAAVFASSHTQINPGNGNTPTTALCAGSWYSNDNAQKTFNGKVPATKPTGKHLRVVLTWDSRPDLANSINYLTDLDMYCYGTGSIGNMFRKWSTSWEGNVEVVDIPSDLLTPNQTFQVQVQPTVMRFPADPAKNFFYYSVGWTWVKDHAN